MRDIGAFFYFAENTLRGYQAAYKKNDTMMDTVQTGNPTLGAVLIDGSIFFNTDNRLLQLINS